MTTLTRIDPYPYDKLEPLRAAAARHAGGVVDLSVGTPSDEPPGIVVDALASAHALRGYPPSIGSMQLRQAAQGWLASYLHVDVDPDSIAACVGTKEFVASLPALLKVLIPDRDTVLYPEVSYPTYAMGATLARCRAVPVSVDPVTGDMDLASVDPTDRERALCLWVNSPSNPSGALSDLAGAAAWGRAHRVPVFSDECYVAYTWASDPASVLQAGLDGVVAVHSLSKRSNLAGLRVGFFAGDTNLVGPLSELRKHAGMMVPGPAQFAAAAALGDEVHVEQQRDRYRSRLERVARLLSRIGLSAPLPAGGFYLWCPVDEPDAWPVVTRLAEDYGVLASPGEFYGDAGRRFVRFAVVAPDSALDLFEARIEARS